MVPSGFSPSRFPGPSGHDQCVSYPSRRFANRHYQQKLCFDGRSNCCHGVSTHGHGHWCLFLEEGQSHLHSGTLLTRVDTKKKQNKASENRLTDEYKYQIHLTIGGIKRTSDQSQKRVSLAARAPTISKPLTQECPIIRHRTLRRCMPFDPTTTFITPFSTRSGLGSWKPSHQGPRRLTFRAPAANDRPRSAFPRQPGNCGT